MGQIDAWLECLQSNGYRLTAPRRAVVEVIATSPRLLNPFEIFESARRVYPRLGLVTVYRTIDKLVELGLIQRVHQPSDCQAFVATSPKEHQHMLICQACGRVEFFSGDEGMQELMEAVGNKSGFQVKEHWLQLFGLCGDCQSSLAQTDLRS